MATPLDARESLTSLERETIRKTGEVWNLLCVLTGDDVTRASDLNEMMTHIHAIQRYVASNAAARAYPAEFRALGETIP